MSSENLDTSILVFLVSALTAVVVSFLCSLAEAVLLSLNPIRLETFARQGKKHASLWLSMKQNIDRPIAAILILNTIAHTGGATIAGGAFDDIYGDEWLWLFSVIFTFVILFGTEIIPKVLGVSYNERVASWIAPALRGSMTMLKPVIFLTEMVSSVFKNKDKKATEGQAFIEEEIKVMVERATQAGVFKEEEQDMVVRVFRLGDRRIGALMTPRKQIVRLDLDDAPEENWRKISASGHTYFPVYQENLDNVVGLLSVKDLWTQMLSGQAIDLKRALKRPLFVPESIPALKVLELFKQSGTHVAVVMDEYSSIQGLVTSHDILEAIVGDLPSLGKPTESSAVQREDGSWLLDGMLSVDEFKEIFALESLPDEEKGYYQTLAGFIIMLMERIPSEGDHFEWDGLRFEVMNMDGKRVDKVLVMRVVAQPTTSTEEE